LEKLHQQLGLNNQKITKQVLYHFSLFVAGILLPSPRRVEGLGVRAINHLCHYFRKMVLMDSWNEAYSDRSDESETLMLEGTRHHQRQLSE